MPRHDGTPTRAEARELKKQAALAARDAELAKEREREREAGEQLRRETTAVGDAEKAQETRDANAGPCAAATAVDAPQRAVEQQEQGEQAEQPAQGEQRKKLGRPSEYTPEEADRICQWIADGKSLKSYCRQTGRHMITVYAWMREHPDFLSRYARAREDRADSLADEMQDIADETTSGTFEQIAAAKLRIETRKWIASKLRPGTYGDRIEVEQKGNVTFQIGLPRRTIDVTPAPEQLSGATAVPAIGTTAVLDATVIDAKSLIRREEPADT